MRFGSGTAAAVAVTAMLLLSGCAGAPGPIAQAPGIQAAPVEGLPRPSALERVAQTEPLLVSAYDKIEVDVYGVADLKRTVSVDSGGAFSFPLAGQIQAAGKNPSEIEQDLTERLRPFVKNPQVTVNVVDRVSQALTVDGQVNRPGQLQINGRQTLMRAVAGAGGTTQFARLDDVIVFRTVAGQRYVGIYNLSAIRRGNYPDPEVFANDIVIVGDSKARRLFLDILQATPVLTAPLYFLIK
ncbi:MAG: polysaccharide biosynthesis/export family protein [Sphingomonas sp.]